jgi:hypothetical protein
MRQNASNEKPGVAWFKLRHELSVYEAAFGQFAALQVNAQEIDKAVTLWRLPFRKPPMTAGR